MAQQRVVVGVDGSPLSMAAVTRAAQVASARGYSLHVLHAFAPDLPMLGFGELSDGSAVVSSHAKRLVADGVARAHAVDPALTVTTGIRDGYASQALVDAARAAALVVVGAMGHGVFGRTSVGAVAMQVVARTPAARCSSSGTSARRPRQRPTSSGSTGRAVTARPRPHLRRARPGGRYSSTSSTRGRRARQRSDTAQRARAGAPTRPTWRRRRVGDHRAAPRPQRRVACRGGHCDPVQALVDRSEGRPPRRRQPRRRGLRAAARGVDRPTSHRPRALPVLFTR